MGTAWVTELVVIGRDHKVEERGRKERGGGRRWREQDVSIRCDELAARA